MRFVAPLGLAAAAFAGPLVLWYVLRSRRPRVEVASTYLWAQTQHSVSAAVPWQRFMPDRTFWLVLAAVLVGALAIARPAFPVAAELGDHTILIIDTSASMQADEGGPTRLELARRLAAELVADLSSGQTVSVIEAGTSARVVLSAGTEARVVDDAIEEIRPGQGSADLADAFTLAAALTRADQDTVTHLLTDGVVPDESAPAQPAGVVVHALGEDRPNLAVTRLEAIPTGGGSAQAFVQVRNFGVVEAEARLTVAVDDVPIVERRLELGPRGVEDLVLPVTVASASNRAGGIPAPSHRAGGTSASPGIVQASISVEGETPFGEAAADALALDDHAYAVLAGARSVQVLVAGPGNVFVESALASVDGVEVRTATAVPDDLAGIDVLVVDRLAAPAAPSVPTVYIAPQQPPTGVEAARAVELPAVTFQSVEHPLVLDVELAGLGVAEAIPASGPTLEALAGGPDGALLLAGQLDGVPVVYLAFDLLQSNLPLQVAWPVLVANIMGWLAAPPAAAPLQVGDEARFTVPPGVTAVTVSPPTGTAVTLDAARPTVTVDHAGVWNAAWEGPDEVLAGLAAPPPVPVNPPGDESDLARDRPAPADGQDDGTVVEAGTATARTGERVVGRELLAGVLVLLLAEWAWSHRRGRAPAVRRRLSLRRVTT